MKNLAALLLAASIFPLGPLAPVRAEPPTPGAGQIPPPFGLAWTEKQESIEARLKAAGASVVQKSELNGREVWTVDGLIQPGLKQTMFYFKKGALVEVELQYEHPDWTVQQFDAFMNDIRKRIEERYGIGTLLARSRAPQEEIMQTVVGYGWNQNNTVLQLFFYSAEKGSLSFRTVSLHYKNNG